MKPFSLGARLTLQDVIDVACGMRSVKLGAPAKAKIAAANRAMKKAAATGDAIYGVNTGFGELASRRIPEKDVRTLQYNLLRSHSSGVGEPLTPEQSRAVIFLRANEFARGHSGCRVEIVEMLVDMLNRGVAPVIPSRGSVGASGDLAPQAHAALVLIGEGHAQLYRRGPRNFVGVFGGNGAVVYKGRWSKAMPASSALKRARLRLVNLEAKEGLSLINGTQAMQAVGGLALHRAGRVLSAVNLAGVMSLEAIKGTPVPFEQSIVGLKPHPGQLWAASELRRLLKGSEIRESHIDGDPRVQDPYSFRCIPQVHGSVKDALDYALGVFTTEVNSVTDNPVVVGGRVIAGGNFHGQALAFASDFAAIALCALANISDRRLAQLISGNHGLRPFLARNPGLESGFMIPQYVTAALASENKILAHPASADSIPTCAGKEDFVSMGMAAVLKLAQIVDHAAQVAAIELMAAAHAVEMHRPLKTGIGVERGLARLRSQIPPFHGDESLSGEFERLKHLILDGFFEAE